MSRSRVPSLQAVWSRFRGQSSRGTTSYTRSPNLFKVARVLVAFALIAAGAIWFGETLLPQQAGTSAGAFWLQAQSPWAPDDSRCRQCGRVLTSRVDALSACRHCDVCNVSYRHQSLPKTLADQERVWR